MIRLLLALVASWYPAKLAVATGNMGWFFTGWTLLISAEILEGRWV